MDGLKKAASVLKEDSYLKGDTGCLGDSQRYRQLALQVETDAQESKEGMEFSWTPGGEKGELEYPQTPRTPGSEETEAKAKKRKRGGVFRLFRKAIKHVRRSHKGLEDVGTKLFVEKKALRPTDRICKGWDSVMTICLLYVATVTPYYISFLPLKLNALFWIDRVVDLLFVLDVVLTFFIAYEQSPRVYVTSKARIAAHYLRGRFWLDIVAVFPYTVVAYAIKDGDNQSNAQDVLRLLRLLVFLRLYRISSVTKKLKNFSGLDFQHLKLLQFLLIYVFSNHWLGCAWRLVPELEEHSSGGWIAATELQDTSNWHLYTAAVYWASMTTTTIGYGDISATTHWERIFVVFAMLVGAGLFAYVVGNICGIVASFNADVTKLYEKLDDLKALCRKYAVPSVLRMQLIRYVRYHWWNRSFDELKDVLDFISPALRQQVLMHAFSDELRKVPGFAKCPEGFLALLAPLVRKEVYGPYEDFTEKDEDGYNRVIIITKGLVATSKGSLKMHDDVIGEDCLWEICTLRNRGGDRLAPMGYDSEEPLVARTLTYTVILSVRKEDVLAAAEKFPEAFKLINRSRVRRLAWEGIRAFTQALRTVQMEVNSKKTLKRSTTSRSSFFDKHDRNLQTTYEQVLASVVRGKLKHGHNGVAGLGREVLAAAVKIQRAYRKYALLKEFARKVHHLARIQALFRGRQARKEYRALLELRFVKSLAKDASARTEMEMVLGARALLQDMQSAHERLAWRSKRNRVEVLAAVQQLKEEVDSLRKEVTEKKA